MLSGKGGVGKSTVTGQLSFGLAANLLESNKNVYLIEIAKTKKIEYFFKLLKYFRLEF